MKLLILVLNFLLLSASLNLISCSQDKKESPKSDLNSVIKMSWALQAHDQAQIKVINQFGEPIASAQILIGSAVDTPFTGNLLVTDKAGAVSIPKDWSTEAHVTVDAAGFIRLTLLNQKPGDLTIRLAPLHLAQNAEIRGQVTQLPVNNGDKLIDFGLVMPTLNRADLLSFDINEVISPYSDILSVAGQHQPIPTNVSLPEQKENYFINLTISKPLFRIQTPTKGPKRFYAARGRFVFKTVVDEMRQGKPFYDQLNNFDLTGGGLREISVVNPVTNLDIPANEIEFKGSMQVQAVTGAVDEVMLLMAASQVADSMIPTDIKKILTNQPMTLKTMTGKPSFVVSVLQKQSEFMTNLPGSDRMSAALVPYVAGLKPNLLPLITNPQVAHRGAYAIRFPASPTKSGIYKIAQSISLSNLVEVQNGDAKMLMAHPRWEIYGLGWNEQVQLPNWPLTNTTAKMRVGVSFIGSTKNVIPVLDDSLIEATTHVSHASTDF